VAVKSGYVIREFGGRSGIAARGGAEILGGV
jgi:hypothetical protein